jgi:hypothetical protein
MTLKPFYATTSASRMVPALFLALVGQIELRIEDRAIAVMGTARTLTAETAFG